jgi:hypothetical protein
LVLAVAAAAWWAERQLIHDLQKALPKVRIVIDVN